MFGCIRLFLVSSIIAGGWCAVKAPSHAHASPTIETVGAERPVRVPYGWYDFCRRYDNECGGPRLEPVRLAMTAALHRSLDTVNLAVNHAVKPMSDIDHWGVVDQWDYPTDGFGDCEDYALEKRRRLIAMGLPRQALLMTVVRDARGDGHAILTIVSDHGDYVLDNLSDTMKPWNETGYHFVKRQSQADQDAWITLESPDAAVAVVARRAAPLTASSSLR